jgi:hypothetical protein
MLPAIPKFEAFQLRVEKPTQNPDHQRQQQGTITEQEGRWH